MTRSAILCLAVAAAVCLSVLGCSRAEESGNLSARGTEQQPEASSQKIVVPNSAPVPRDAWNYPLYNGWSPKRIFADPKVVELCYAIADQDYEAVLRLVQKEGVDINARGFRNFTPLYWAFPLGRTEAVHRWSSAGLEGRDPESRQRIRQIERQVLSKHAAFLEKLLKLGADPNIVVHDAPRSEILGPMKFLALLGINTTKRYSVTHRAVERYGPSEFNYLPIVMAHGGDPNVVDPTSDRTPTALLCSASTIVSSLRPCPENLALMIDAHADLEWQTREGDTPILLAAHASRYGLVSMLICAGADFRVANNKGENLASFVKKRKRFIDIAPMELKTFVEERIKQGISPGIRCEIDPYFLEVVAFLEQEGMLPGGTREQWKSEIDEAVGMSVAVAYGQRDPFLDDWLAKRSNKGDRAIRTPNAQRTSVDRESKEPDTEAVSPAALAEFYSPKITDSKLFFVRVIEW